MLSESMAGLHTRLLLVFFLSTLFSLSTSNDSLTSNQPLADGETLVSAGGSFVLGFFSPNGSNDRYVGIWYGKVSVQTVVWVANRQRPITNSTGSMAITTNGSLIITAYSSTVIWSFAVTGVVNPVAQLLDSGNFVVREASGGGTGEFAWQSFDYPTDTLLPGMKLGWNLTSGLDRRLTSWTSASDPSPGGYSAFIDIHGDPQLVLSQGSNWIWRAGPWNGLQFSGVPQMNTFHVFDYNFVHTQDEVYYIYYLVSNSTISRLTVDSSGTLQRTVWLGQANMWNSYWHWPKDVCDSVSPCGPNGVCSADSSPTCSCLQGFEPKSPAEWALRDGSKGCVRRTALDCRNSTGGFAKESKLKLPDTSNATVDMSMSLDECRTKCLSNCLCTGYASANVSGGESGCIIWTSQLTDIRVYTDNGQDLYVRLAAADLVITGTNVTDSNGSKSHKIRQVAIVLGAIFGALFLTFIGCLIWRNKKRKRGTLSFIEFYQADNTGDNSFELPIYDLRTILTATDDFSMENKLGEGGFGPVYKGKLDGREIAVKRLSETSFQGLEEFKNEVTLIAKLQHRNLVRLLGCCIHGQERMLVYEYMPNKSLDVLLFDKSKRTSLDWQTRYRIIVGIVRGLLYLHEDSRLRIIHRDLKASNILLDGEMNPKISDFGLARIFAGDEKEANTRRVVGTYGYMSPEYAMDGKFSVKSDVFSFGVLVLEIISGVKNRGVYTHGPHENLLGHAWNLLMEGNALELVDKSMTDSYSAIEASRCIRVGLLCVQERPEDRPTMSRILQMLGSDDALPPRPKKPGFVSVRSSLETSSSASKQASSTIYDLTVTILDGR